MTTDRLTTSAGATTPVAAAAPPIAGASPGRVRLVAAALALGSLAVATVLVWQPWGERDAFGYADLAPLRDGVWAGTLVDGFGFALATLALSLVTCLLVRSRGSRFATVGAAITTVGGILFAMGSMAHGAVAWFATSDVVSVGAGTALLEHVEDQPLRVMGPVMAGFLLVAIGMLVLGTAMLRSGGVPRWVPMAMIVLTLAQFAPVPARALDLIQVLLMGVLVCLAGVVAGRTRT